MSIDLEKKENKNKNKIKNKIEQGIEYIEEPNESIEANK